MLSRLVAGYLFVGLEPITLSVLGPGQEVSVGH